MRALITGGAGFIGSHLAEALIGEGQSVTVLDDLSTGSIDNVRALASHPAFRLVRGSVTDASTVAPLVDSADVIFHLAAAVGVRLVVERPVHTIQTNVTGTEVVLRHAHRAGVPVIVASSSEVYGNGTALPFREDEDLLLGPPTIRRWGYAASKLLDEFLALAYHAEYGTPVVVARFFNTVGPRQNSQYGMVLPTFVQRALADLPIEIHGTGTQSRCFTWVGDTVRALLALSRDPRAVGQVFNVGNPEEISIVALAKQVRREAASRSPLVHIPYHVAFGPGFQDVGRRVPDSSRLEQLLGGSSWHWVPLDEIVRRTVRYWADRADDPQLPSEFSPVGRHTISRPRRETCGSDGLLSRA